MLLRRYHKLEEEKSPNDFIADVDKAIDEEVILEPIIEPTEEDLNLEELTVKELKEIATERQIEVPDRVKKDDLIKLIREG